MDKPFDWNRMRAFLASAEAGSLSAGAKSIGSTQPTLSRQIAALEEELDVMLFERVGRGLQLTLAGQTMLTHVREMGAAADKVALAAIGQSTTIEGAVRITAINLLSVTYLPAALAKIRAAAPRLRIDVIATNDIRDLMRREADIAIRHVRPDQPDLVARLLREAQASLYASEGYVQAHGLPQTPADLANHDFVAFGDPTELLGYLTDLGLPITLDNLMIGSEDGLVAWEMARAGLGICIMDQAVAKHYPGMVRILPDMPPVTYPVWLTTHREIHTSPRIRLVFDILADVFARP
ncbi:LysR family transcriptional regulator [Yoonia sp. SS1-5]|uniref:LysR family transcriptional regulator n=1 Tax=Yoonia rhodophyticola TaxID=3137370 RepID=A0AAN0MLN4_9RHOB